MHHLWTFVGLQEFFGQYSFHLGKAALLGEITGSSSETPASNQTGLVGSCFPKFAHCLATRCASFMAFCRHSGVFGHRSSFYLRKAALLDEMTGSSSEIPDSNQSGLVCSRSPNALMADLCTASRMWFYLSSALDCGQLRRASSMVSTKCF